MISSLVAALLALPLPPIASGPEIASTLAVGAVVTLAGLRWGVALLGLTEALLLATFWPFVIHGPADEPLRVVAAAACVAALPGLWSIRRAAPHALELLGVHPSEGAHQTAARLLLAAAVVIVALPLF